MLAAGNQRATSVEHATAAGCRRDPALPFFLERYAAAYRLELDAFCNSIEAQRFTQRDHRAGELWARR